MTVKTKKITFEYRPGSLTGPSKPYLCIKVGNSTEYNPGVWYTPTEVNDLCRNNRWDVTITS